jgi:putative flippase GtrA
MTTLIADFQTNPTLRSAARFAVVGVIGTLIDVILYGGLHLGLGLASLAANTISYSAGIVNNYFWHRGWTFAGREHNQRGQFVKFAAISLSALTINTLLVLALTPLFGRIFADTGVAALLAKAFAVGVGMGWNFLANHMWIFKIYLDKR